MLNMHEWADVCMDEDDDDVCTYVCRYDDGVTFEPRDVAGVVGVTGVAGVTGETST